MLKAIKIRLYLNEEQENYVSNLLGCSRFIYNNLLAYKSNIYNNTKVNISFKEMGKKLTEMKAEHLFLKDVHSKVLQQSLLILMDSYKNFFNGSGFPKFKSKRDSKQSCRFPIDAISGIKGNRINIIKQLKDIHYKCSKRDERILNKHQNLIKSGTLIKTKSGNYYFSILMDLNYDKKLPLASNIIGIDLGIKDFIVTSEGEVFKNIKSIRNNEFKLKKLHRQLSKKKDGSKNKEKARIKLAKMNEKIRNIKENYIHHIVNQLLNENQVIVIEDLNVSGMLKNHKLAKSIQELSLNRFKVILTYKSGWYDRKVIKIGRFFPSSKTCHHCGYVNNELTLKDREWLCPHCNSLLNRDLNAAINIKMEGIKILLGSSSPDFKPLENASVEDSMKKEKNEKLVVTI